MTVLITPALPPLFKSHWSWNRRNFFKAETARGAPQLRHLEASLPAPARNNLQAPGIPAASVTGSCCFYPEREIKGYESWEEGKRDRLDLKTAKPRPRGPFPVSLLPQPGTWRGEAGWAGVRQGQPGRASPASAFWTRKLLKIRISGDICTGELERDAVDL